MGRRSRVPRSAPRALGGRAFYWFVTRLMHLVVWTFGRYTLAGQGRTPRRGPLLVVANHLNNADPPLVASAVPRTVHFMAKQELFDLRPWGVFTRLFGAFPVRRFEADMGALREAQRILTEGGVVGMFPEGHRSHGKGLQTPYPGTALIALRSGATILPVGITGTEAVTGPLVLLQKPRITVTIGEPFTLSHTGRITGDAVRAASDDIMRHIAALLPPNYQGAYAGKEHGS